MSTTGLVVSVLSILISMTDLAWLAHRSRRKRLRFPNGIPRKADK